MTEMQVTLTARPHKITDFRERSENIFSANWSEYHWYCYFKAVGAEESDARLAAIQQLAMKQ